MVHDPVEQGHDKYNSFPQFIQFQLNRADASGTEILILLVYLAVQLDLRTVTDWNRNVHSTVKECLWRFISITCAVKLFSNVKLELTCSNNVVGSLTFEVYSIKLEMNNSATSIKECLDTWRIPKQQAFDKSRPSKQKNIKENVQR